MTGDHRTDGDLRLVPAVESAAEEARRLLAEAGLPTSDLDDTVLYVALDDEGFRVGVGGIEPHPPVGLLRSVAVREEDRGDGYGTTIVSRLEDEARSAGLDELYLLTASAEEFFAGLGYEPVARDALPPEIEGTSQVQEVCPDSATVMRKSL